MHRTGIVLLVAAAMLATPPGRAQSSVDPVALAKAKELLAVSNVVAMRDQIAALLQRQIAALIQQANPGQEAQVDQAVKELIQPALEQRIPEFLDAAAAIYAKYFTRDELAQLVAFYKSPVAQKLTHVAPEITDLMRDWPNRVGNDILKQSAADLRKRGLKLPGA